MHTQADKKEIRSRHDKYLPSSLVRIKVFKIWQTVNQAYCAEGLVILGASSTTEDLTKILPFPESRWQIQRLTTAKVKPAKRSCSVHCSSL